MTPETRCRLLKLIPKLSAMTDRHRLKVLGDIDRVLAAEGVTWADIAALLEERTNEYADISADEVLAAVDFIALRDAQELTDSARDFLRQLAHSAEGAATVSMSARQREWLGALYHNAAQHQQHAAEDAMASAPSTMAVH